MRSLLLGLLLVGVTPIVSKAIAYSELSQTSAGSLHSTSLVPEICHRTRDIKNCFNTVVTENRNFNSHLGLLNIISLLLPQWTIARCSYPSSTIGQDLVCLSSSAKLLHFNLNSQLIAHANLKSDRQPLVTELSTKSDQFPPLSRSSLIVTSPNNNRSLCSPSSTSINSCSSNKLRLIKPAPETTRIASSFGWRRRPYSGQLQFHQGIDYGAPLGSPVVAAGNGIVTKIVSGCADFGNRWCGNQFGNWIEIDHGHGAIAIYGHLLNRSISVKQGMKVRKNQEIAKVGSSGWSTGAHLDFRLKIRGNYQNPAEYIP